MFKKLKALEVSGNTAKLTLYQIEGEPVLILKPATEANKPYFNAILKKSAGRLRTITSGGINSSVIQENRASDRELFPLHVAVGWERVTDDNGAEVTFSSSACAEYFEALPDWIFDEVRTFASNPSNFVTGPSPALVETSVED